MILGWLRHIWALHCNTPSAADASGFVQHLQQQKKKQNQPGGKGRARAEEEKEEVQVEV